MGIFIAILLAAASGGAIYGVLTLINKRISSGIASEKTGHKKKIAELDKEIADLKPQVDRYVSKAQLDIVRNKREEIANELEASRKNLQQSEEKLDAAQKSVVARESKQQELKALRDEETGKLEQIVTAHETLSSESLGLENQLADSMKQLDSLQNEVELTDKQREAFQKISEVLSSAGERMRELIGEYDSVNERLVELGKQHKDLEDEYTRLVEQQLTSQ